MHRPQELSQFEDRWVTGMGAAVSQSPVMFRDRGLHGDLCESSWLEVYLYGITGRSFNTLELRVLNAIWTFTSYPDPRIWNNRVAALAGTARSTGTLAISSAIAVSEAELYGGKPLIRAIDTLKRAKDWVQNGNLLDDFVRQELKRHRKIAGFGRPQASGDERIKPMLDFLQKIGHKHGPHIDIAFNIEKFLREGRWRFRMNYAGLVAALCADMGFSTSEFYRYMIPVFLAGFTPCYMDALEHPKGSFFPIRCTRINYEGPERRSWD
ncbi:MAG: citryl-CoA lyase [Methylococcales bacterium]